MHEIVTIFRTCEYPNKLLSQFIPTEQELDHYALDLPDSIWRLLDT